MRVNHCRGNILVTEQILYRTDVITVAQQMGRKTDAVCEGGVQNDLWSNKSVHNGPIQNVSIHLMLFHVI